jgi:REP element-mobilizing transposase RayT
MSGDFDQRPLAKPARSEYRRDLPHLQVADKPLFVTFCTYRRWVLPESVRGLVIEHCVHDHGTKLHMFGAVAMPDHVHLVFVPLRDATGRDFGLAEIMRGIKGASAHAVNKAIGRRGHVWQEESYDHVCRRDESVEDVVEYMFVEGWCERRMIIHIFGGSGSKGEKRDLISKRYEHLNERLARPRAAGPHGCRAGNTEDPAEGGRTTWLFPGSPAGRNV